MQSNIYIRYVVQFYEVPWSVQTNPVLKHTTLLFFFSLSDHGILSQEWGVIVDQVKTNYHGWPIVL